MNKADIKFTLDSAKAIKNGRDCTKDAAKMLIINLLEILHTLKTSENIH